METAKVVSNIFRSFISSRWPSIDNVGHRTFAPRDQRHRQTVKRLVLELTAPGICPLCRTSWTKDLALRRRKPRPRFTLSLRLAFNKFDDLVSNTKVRRLARQQAEA